MGEMMHLAGGGRTRRFAEQRQDIMDAAASLINIHGVIGFTLGETAKLVGLTNNSMRYYFRRKDDLLLCCFNQSLDGLEALVQQAETAQDAPSRVRRFIDIAFTRMSQITLGAERRFLRVQDLRAIDEPLRSQLLDRYSQIFRRIQSLFGQPCGPDDGLAAVHTHVLLESLYGLSSWLDGYMPTDHERVREQFASLLVRGLSPDAPWKPMPLALEDDGQDSSQRDFLNAATKLINELGYRGASVERISAELSVTKGSFYHHLSGKDDLVLGCFERSFELIDHAHDAAQSLTTNRLEQLMSAVTTLVQMQFSEERRLLRSSAVLALPPELRTDVVDRSNKIARRFSGMIVDGMCDGSIPPTDPIIAGYSLRALLNAAYEISVSASGKDTERLTQLCAASYFYGIFAGAECCRRQGDM